MRILFSFILVFAIFSTGKVFAQGCEAPSGDNDALKIFGFFQPQYEFHSTSAESTNTFKFKRARIGATGNIPYDFSYYIVMENSAFVSKTGNPYLLDAFITYNRFKWAKVSVGSFKQPFGQEVNTSCSGLHTIERSLVSDQLISPQRDMGIMLLGGTDETLVKYAIALMNGSGLGIVDNNTKKDFVGRVTVKPLSFLRFGGSYRYGFPLTNDANRMSYAAELQIEYNALLVQGEYIYDEGSYNTAAGGGCGSEPLVLGQKRSGYYVQAMYMTPWMLQPVAKAEMFDRDLTTADNSFTTFTLGLNYFFNDWTRLQVNYRYTMDDAGLDPTELKVQLQVKF